MSMALSEAAMSEYDAEVSEIVRIDADRGLELFEEFSQRMAKLRDEGLVDCKLKLPSDADNTTRNVIALVNNLLRLREEGKVRRLFT